MRSGVWRRERRPRSCCGGRASSVRLAGSPGIGVRVASCVPLIRSMRSSITTRGRAAGVATSSPSRSGGPGGGSVAVRSRSCRRSPWSGPSIARISCAVGTAWHAPSARLPDQVGACVFGPRLQAAMVTLTARHRVSRRGVVELARDLFGVTLSTGSVDAICQRASEALAGPHLQLHDWVLDQAAVRVDETGWRTSGEGRALWTATTAAAAFFQIAEHCNREQFQALIGPYPGIVVSDRWNGYAHLDPNQRQVCWSHLRRDFRRHADGLAEQKTFGERGLPLTDQLFAAWRSYQHEHHDRQRLLAEISPIKTELRTLLEHASPKSRRNRWHRQFANNLLKVWPALWTFTTTDGVEPTNNPAERALRGPVIHRKLSLGTQSPDGERFAERALPAATTCRMQRRSLFTYLSELLAAHNRGDHSRAHLSQGTERLPKPRH